MRKMLYALLVVLLLFVLYGCDSANKKEYDKIDHTSGITGDVTGAGKKDPKALVICLDPGHGGRWQGAIYHDREERDIVLELAKEIRSYLNEHYPEIKVYLTREDNNVFSNDIGTDLRARVEFAKSCDADILISLHLNASENHNMHGSMVCISKQPNINGISVELADALLDATEGLGLKRNGYETRNSTDTFDENGEPVDYYAICRHGASLDIPAVILESCFMDHDTDYPYIETDEALKRLAEAEAEAMAQFMLSHFPK